MVTAPAPIEVAADCDNGVGRCVETNVAIKEFSSQNI